MKVLQKREGHFTKNQVRTDLKYSSCFVHSITYRLAHKLVGNLFTSLVLCGLFVVGHRKMPARVDGEWNEAMMNIEAPGHDFRWDPAMGLKPPRKKRVSKKEKGEKPEKPPSGKKRGRKPKTDKLGSAGRLADTGGAVVPPDGAALEWTGFSLSNRMEGGVNQVPVIEEVPAGHVRAALAKSPHESAKNPAFPAFSDEVSLSVVRLCAVFIFTLSITTDREFCLTEISSCV